LSISNDEMEQLQGLQRISAAMGYAYTHLNTKEIIKFRQSMDIFLDKLLVDTDPTHNMREALKIRILKNESKH